MNFYAFRLLSPAVQRYLVFKYGTYLARRWEGARGINLYHCEYEGRGFFVEANIATGQGQAVVICSFMSNGPLKEYAQGVQLPPV